MIRTQGSQSLALSLTLTAAPQLVQGARVNRFTRLIANSGPTYRRRLFGQISLM